MRQHELKLMEFPLQFNDDGQILSGKAVGPLLDDEADDSDEPQWVKDLADKLLRELESDGDEGPSEAEKLFDSFDKDSGDGDGGEPKGGGGVGNAIQPEPGKGPLSAVNVANQNRPADISIPLNAPARNKHGQIITPGTSDSGGGSSSGGGTKDACFPKEGKS